MIDKLLYGQKVEWKTLGEVAEYEQPTKYIVQSTNYSDKFPTPVLTAGKTFILGYTDEEIGIREASKLPIILFDDFTSANRWIDFDFKVKSSATKIITAKNENEVILKYIFYIMQTMQNVEVYAAEHKRLWISNFSQTKIPIPPLPVQQEIVRILDKFTALTAELTAELTARKKQYSFYREQLLVDSGQGLVDSGKNLLTTNHDELTTKKVEWKTLGEVAGIGTGSHNTQDAIEDGIYAFYARGITPLKLNSYDFDETAIITAGDGVGVGKVFHWVSGKYALHQRAYRIVPNKSVSSRYIYHYMICYFYDYILKTSVSSSVTSMRKPMFLKFPIPIPPLSEQERIVAILDKMDTLTNSISEGLPKEIELRQKQYEYYRDLLLTFPLSESGLSRLKD